MPLFQSVGLLPCGGRFLALAAGLLAGVVQPAWGAAAAPAGPAAPAPAAEPESFWWLLFFGAGWFGFVIMVLLALCSVAVLAVIIQGLLTVNRRALVPVELAAVVQQQLRQGEIKEAEQLCIEQPSFLAAVLAAGLQEIGHGYEAAEKAMEETAQVENARLHRRVESISLLSSIAPMLGLLGTVWGMVVAFQQVAETHGRADPGQLAGGIYQALYTTVFGLVIAIPGLACYGLLRNHVDQLSAEAAELAERIFAPLKRKRIVRRPPEPAPGAAARPTED